jgi:hypothetical protein
LSSELSLTAVIDEKGNGRTAAAARGRIKAVQREAEAES